MTHSEMINKHKYQHKGRLSVKEEGTQRYLQNESSDSQMTGEQWQCSVLLLKRDSASEKVCTDQERQKFQKLICVVF